MKNLKKWFTLVELIVVITILAILGTIAFISLQGYSADARNSKRVSDLGSIGSAISVKLTQWVSLLAFVTSTPNSQISAVSIGGTGATVSEYAAGPVNYTAVGIKKEDFVDPNGVDYVGWVTTKINGKYQLAAKMEQGGWASVAKIFGDYTPRTDNTAAANTVTLTTTGTIVSIGTADIGKLKEGDTIGVERGNTAGSTIAKVSADGKQLTLSSAATSIGTLSIAASESAGLIDAAGASTGPVTDAGTVLPY